MTPPFSDSRLIFPRAAGRVAASSAARLPDEKPLPAPIMAVPSAPPLPVWTRYVAGRIKTP